MSEATDLSPDDSGQRPEAAQVVVVLALHNGARFIEEQLDSILSQTIGPCPVIIGDDGSTDDGPERIRALLQRHPGADITVIPGAGRGFAQNFLHLIRAARRHGCAVALADQDDVWLPHKLERSLAFLKRMPVEMPALYGSRTWICNSTLGQMQMSPLHARPASFRNALVQSLAGGNTMMLNAAAVDLVCEASHEAEAIVAHDWWLYQVISGVGGNVVYDPEPTVLYRQHGNNQIGSNRGLLAGLLRVRMLMAGRFRSWNSINIVALKASQHRFTLENRRTLAEFSQIHGAGLMSRIGRMRRLRLYRQTLKGSLALWLATMLNQV